MSTIEFLTQQQFIRVRTEVAFAILGTTAQLARHPLEADEKQRGENIMNAGLVDVQRVLDRTDFRDDLPLIHSVIEVPVRQAELNDTYFVVDQYETGVEVILIKSDYAREDFGLYLGIDISALEGWKYVYPKDAS